MAQGGTGGHEVFLGLIIIEQVINPPSSTPNGTMMDTSSEAELRLYYWLLKH